MIENFIRAYEPQYGPETKKIILSLINKNKKVALLNPFIPKYKLEKILQGAQASKIFSQAYYLQQDFPPQEISGLLSHYFMDESSLIAPLLLPIKSNLNILDMCSAPGGKLLVLLARKIKNINYIANDNSKARIFKLINILKKYVPENFLREHIKISCKNGTWFGLRQKDYFDGVLLDAPCSSEAHLLKSETQIKKFTGIRKSLPQRQYALACAAILTLKPGGFLIYSTCSINKKENHEVVKKLISKKNALILNNNNNNFGESILPHEYGMGPAFAAILQKAK